MRVGLYARISEDRDETQMGVNRQLEDCQTLCLARNWTIVERYVDNDLSAYKNGRRPEYRRLLADIAEHRIDGVVVYHQDRLHRQPRELEEFFDVCDRAGLQTLASVSGDIDLATHDGRLKARILGAVARNQSDASSRRLKRKALQIAQAGEPSGGGHRPFGFEADRVTIRPDEAAIIRELAERLLAGETLRGLCAELNARGILTTAGGEWIPTPLRRMLSSGRLSGLREHRGEIVASARWPAIITAEQTARIRALFANPSRRAARAPRAYLLKRLVRCGRCDALMVGRPREDGQRRYTCAAGPGFPGCGHTHALAEPLEAFATEAVLWRLDSPELERAITGRRQRRAGSEWQQQADLAAARLDELAGAYGGGKIGLREWLTAREPWQGRLDDARAQMARAQNVTAIADYVGRGGMLRERWPGLSLDRRHAIIGAVLLHIVVGPGRRGYNRFDPDRFELVWRH